MPFCRVVVDTWTMWLSRPTLSSCRYFILYCHTFTKKRVASCLYVYITQGLIQNFPQVGENKLWGIISLRTKKDSRHHLYALRSPLIIPSFCIVINKCVSFRLDKGIRLFYRILIFQYKSKLPNPIERS